MALRKEVKTKQGYTAEYWKVNRIEIDKNNRNAKCVLNVYKDESMSHTKDGYFGELSRMVILNNYPEGEGVDYTVHPELEIEPILEENEVVEPTLDEEFGDDSEELIEPPLDEEFGVDSEEVLDSDVDTSPKFTDRFERYFGDNSIYEDVYEACYNMVKELETFFIDATDC